MRPKSGDIGDHSIILEKNLGMFVEKVKQEALKLSFDILNTFRLLHIVSSRVNSGFYTFYNVRNT